MKNVRATNTEWNKMKEHTAHAVGCLILDKGEKAARKMYETQWSRGLKAANEEIAKEAAYVADLKAQFPHLETHKERAQASLDEELANWSPTVHKQMDTSPERIKELKAIMQREHPDKGGDEDVFFAAKRELEDIRTTLRQ